MINQNESLPLFQPADYTNPHRHKNQAAFDKYHADNPQVYRWLVDKARTAKARGRKKYAIKALIELIRWHYRVETLSEDFKIPNNHAPFYARLIMAENPELADFFNVHEQTG